MPGPGLEHLGSLGADAVGEHESEHLQRLGAHRSILEPDRAKPGVIVSLLHIFDALDAALQELVQPAFFASLRILLLNPRDISTIKIINYGRSD